MPPPVTTPSSALAQSLMGKIARHAITRSWEHRFATIVGARPCATRVYEVLDYFVCQHCARNNVFIKGYPVFAQYKAMSALYTKAHFSPMPLKDGYPRQQTATITIGGHDMLVAQAHFLWWMILHDIDVYVLPRMDEIEREMSKFKRDMARKYRRRQRAKRRRTIDDGGGREGERHLNLALGKTATQYAKHVPPVLATRRGMDEMTTAI